MASQANFNNSTLKETISSEKEVVKEDVESLKKALEAEKAKAEEYLNRLKYLQADFENYIKKIKKDFEVAVKFSSEKLILNLIDIVEDFERVLQASKNLSDKTLVEGVEMIYKKLKTTLENEGVKEIEAVGKIFNPALHEAVGFIETSEHPEGTIVNEIRKGYFLGDKVIKPSLVEVAKAPSKK